MRQFEEPKLNLNTVLTDDSYYHQLFKKVNYYSPQVYQIFDIARKLMAENATFSSELSALLKPEAREIALRDESEKTVRSTKTTSGSDDFFVDNMRAITEFPYLLKKQFLLPDEIFDQKLIHKELLIKKKFIDEKRLSFTDFLHDKNALTKEKFLRRQRTYVLMDVSGSTEKRDRILLEKAIVLSFLENNQKEFGEVYFRTFNHQLGDLFRTLTRPDYKRIVNQAILPALPEGQTNTAQAVQKALEDIVQYGITGTAEILLVTDGLSQVDAEALLQDVHGVKINVVMIGRDPIYFTDDELKEHFNQQHQRELHKIESNHFSEAAKKKKEQLEQFQKFDKKKAQLEIEQEYRYSIQQLALLTGGAFIEIDDLDQSFFSDNDLLAHIEREIAFLQERLKTENLSPLERDQLLEEYFSLKNYLNYLLEVHRKNAVTRDRLAEFSEEMLTYLKNDDQLLHDLENSSLRVQMSFSDLNQLKSISMFQLFKLLFKKVRYLVFKSTRD